MEGDGLWKQKCRDADISIHALRVEGDLYDLGGALWQRISIHALRVEGDLRQDRLHDARLCISIHALRVEGDNVYRQSDYESTIFLSTPSGWRATLGTAMEKVNIKAISIHALRVEGDSKNGQSFRLFLRKREKNLPL